MAADNQLALFQSLRRQRSRRTADEKSSSTDPVGRAPETRNARSVALEPPKKKFGVRAPAPPEAVVDSTARGEPPARLPDLEALLAERTHQPLSSLRVAQGFDRLLSNAAPPRRLVIAKPGKNEWVRTRADLVLDVPLLNFKAGARDDGYYVLDAAIAAELADAVPGFLAATVNQDGRIGAWPLPWPATDGPPLAHYETAIRAAQLGYDAWVNIKSLSVREGYKITPVQNAKLPPWGDLSASSFSDLVRASERFIDSLDHPVLRTARGDF